jgi:multidrug efflux pump subunit AcrA (membrane-fusion protein)
MTQSPDGLTATNGPASLSDRVKGLRLNDRLDSPKTGRGGSAWLPWTLCLLMALTWASFGVRAYTTGGWKTIFGQKSDDHAAPVAPSSDGGKKDKSAGTTSAPTSPDQMLLEVKGYIVASQQIQVGPDRVIGKVNKLYITEGKFFEAGKPLAEVDDLDYRADYDQMKASRMALEAQLDEMKHTPRLEEIAKARAIRDEAAALLGQLQRDLARYDDMKARNLSFSDKEYDQARSSVEIQKAKLAQMENDFLLVKQGPHPDKIRAMEAQVVQAKARERQAKEMLDRCVIRAPVSGIILSKRTEVGNLVNPLAMNTSFNGGVCEIADLTDLEVDLEVEERNIRKVSQGQECLVRADAHPDRKYLGRVDRIMPTANRSRGIIPVRVKVRVPRSEEGVFLKPEMAAVVWFYDRKLETQPTNENVGK